MFFFVMFFKIKSRVIFKFKSESFSITSVITASLTSNIVKQIKLCKELTFSSKNEFRIVTSSLILPFEFRYSRKG